jgi:hypothetical protein
VVDTCKSAGSLPHPEGGCDDKCWQKQHVGADTDSDYANDTVRVWVVCWWRSCCSKWHTCALNAELQAKWSATVKVEIEVWMEGRPRSEAERGMVAVGPLARR